MPEVNPTNVNPNVTSEPAPAAAPKVSTQPAAQTPAVAPKNDDPKRWEWKFSPGIGTEEGGGRSGGLVFIDNISKYGDYTHLRLDGALMRDLLGDKVRFRAGPFLAFDASNGNENTGGSTLRSLTVGPRAELDWSRAAYKNGGLWNILSGPSRAGLYGGIGYGWGTTNVDGGFQLHAQSGLATVLGLDLNLFNFNIGNVAVGGDVFGQQHAIYGSAFNSAGRTFGFQVTIRPSTKKLTIEKPVKTCDDDVAAIARQEAKVKELRQKNDELTAQLGELRFYLDNHPKHPFTSDNVRNTMVLGAVAQQLNINKVDKAKIAAAVKAANEAGNDEAKMAQAISKETGISVVDAKGMLEGAKNKYNGNFDFWKADEDPSFQLRSDVPKNPNAKQCEDVQKYRDELEDVIGKLQKRQGQLEKLFQSAVHLAGLFLGEKSTEEILSAVVLNIDTPSYKTDFPTPVHMNRLKGGTSADTTANQVFSVPPFEKKKLDQLAGWLNGTGDLPGEERIREILNKEFGNTPMASDTPEAKDAIRAFHKKLGMAIFGHTDTQGIGRDKAKNEEYNQGLSERRAEFIRQYLISRGVDGKRLIAKGFGQKYPAMPEGGKGVEDLIAKGKNRRTEFVLFNITEPITPRGSENPEHIEAPPPPARKPTAPASGQTAPAANPGTATPSTPTPPASAPKPTTGGTLKLTPTPPPPKSGSLRPATKDKVATAPGAKSPF